MKFLHTADLHIGKVVNDFSMLADQKYILDQIRDIAVANEVDGILLAGDIYDRAIPSAEAVQVFDEFVTALAGQEINVFFISGNHDSAERLGFLEELLVQSHICIGTEVKEQLPRYQLQDQWGVVEIVLLPFLRPAQVDAASSQEAVSRLMQEYWAAQEEDRDTGGGRTELTDCGACQTPHKRRILVTHYFVTDAGWEPELLGGESTVHVGGLDQVDASCFAGFDYVALGHIHKPQQIGQRPVYYAGAPLKYSFGEVNQTKSVLLLELDGTGLSQVRRIPLMPLREMRKVQGRLEELLVLARQEEAGREDYVQAILTDPGEVVDPIGVLRRVYPNIMQILRQESRQEGQLSESDTDALVQTLRVREPAALFGEFYQLVSGETMTDEEREIVETLVRDLKED